MAGTAVASFNIVKHREPDSALLGRGEYLGMAEFTAVPDGMFLVGEVNGVNPRVACLDGKIFPALHGHFLGGYTFHKIDGFDDPRLLGFLPVHTVYALGEFRGKFPVLIRSNALPPQGVAAVAARVAPRIGARSKDGLPREHLLSIVAGAAMEAFTVRGCIDTGSLRLHGKADIDMTNSASELRPVQPVIKDHGTGTGLWVIVENYLAIFRGFRWILRQID